MGNNNRRAFGFALKPSALKRASENIRLGVTPKLDESIPVAVGASGTTPANAGIAANAVNAALTSLANTFDANDIDNVLILRWRSMEQDPLVAEVLNMIVNSAIVYDNGQQPVYIDIASRANLSSFKKKQIVQEFTNVLGLLNFQSDGARLFRRWYVDSRLVYQKIVNPERPSDGIIELRRIEPQLVKRIRLTNVVNNSETHGVTLYGNANDAFFLIKQGGFIGQAAGSSDTAAASNVFGHTSVGVDGIPTTSVDAGGWKMDHQGRPSSTYKSSGLQVNNAVVGMALLVNADNICFVPSGITDFSMQVPVIVSYLSHATRPMNMYNQSMDALLMYQYARSPDRKIFHVDIGEMDTITSDAYIQKQADNIRSRMTFDPSTGLIGAQNNVLAVQDDIFLPKRSGATSQGWTVEKLEGGAALGDMTPVSDLLKRQFIIALHAPASRLLEANQKIQIGNTDNMERDEVQFEKFICQIQNDFSHLFFDILQTQLLLKEILTPDEWHDLKPCIKFVYRADSVFSERKEQDILSSRLAMLDKIKPYIIGKGEEVKMFTIEYVRKNILKQTEEEIVESESYEAAIDEILAEPITEIAQTEVPPLAEIPNEPEPSLETTPIETEPPAEPPAEPEATDTTAKNTTAQTPL